jgi:hypothetical protein
MMKSGFGALLARLAASQYMAFIEAIEGGDSWWYVEHSKMTGWVSHT